MSPFSPRLALPLCILAGFAVGCASGGARPAATGDPATVTSADLRDRNEPIEVLLQRKVTGLVISRDMNGDLVLQIRGNAASLGNDAPPLYILNGSPYSPGPGGALIGIDAEDIDTIKVLKGPETVIYGIEGANGVIVITTKKGGNLRK